MTCDSGKRWQVDTPNKVETIWNYASCDIFWRLPEELHFTHAAERMHVAQPTLSQQISQLEREVGVKLLERTSRSVVLTPAGEEFRKRASIAIEQLERAAADAGAIGRGEAGSYCSRFYQRFGREHTAECDALVSSANPAAVIDLSELERSDQIESIRQRIWISVYSTQVYKPLNWRRWSVASGETHRCAAGEPSRSLQRTG